MTTSFVTGGSGFVGRNLITALRARGDSVRALARSERAADTVRALGAEPVMGDLQDTAVLATGMRGADAVFHAAALAAEWGDPEDFDRINVLGTESVLAAARTAGVPRLVHVSTEAVLLDGSPLVDVDEARPRPARPLPRYPRTKAEAEARVLAANGNGLETVVARPRLIWGAGDTSVLPQIVKAVRDGRFMWIGGGRHLTSTCHVANVCEGLLLAADKGRPGEIYFLTDGEPVELRSFLGAMLATQGVTVPDKTLPFGLALTVARLCEPVWQGLRLQSPPPITRMVVYLLGREVTVNDAKARRELGYRGLVGRDAGLAAMRRG